MKSLTNTLTATCFRAIRFVGTSFTKQLVPNFVLSNRLLYQMDLTTSKRMCTGTEKNAVKIGTHDGKFHCDEVLACAMLKMLPQFQNAVVVRTRDKDKLAECDVVVDVGSVFDPTTHRYDHHQLSFTETFNSLLPNKPWTIKLSSAGLIYVHFGKDIIANLLGTSSDDEVTEAVFDKVYESFVQEIDAIDNGISMCEGPQKYRICTDLSSRVGNLNPSWNEAAAEDVVAERFEKALTLVGHEFQDKVVYFGRSWIPAKSIVDEAIKKRFDVDSTGAIIELGDAGVPWKEHLFNIEKKLNLQAEIKFVIFQDVKGSWRVQSVPVEPHSFELRVPLHHEWQGLRDEELSTKSQISDCIFVHSTGFIGGNKQKSGAIEMAKKTLDSSKLQNNFASSTQ